MVCDYITRYNKNNFERPEDGYYWKEETWNYLPFLMFPQYGCFGMTQLRALRSNLGYPFVEGQMKIIEQSKIVNFLEERRRQVRDVMKYCRVCQLHQLKPHLLCFLIKFVIVGEFKNTLQMYTVERKHGSMSHIMNIAEGIQDGSFRKIYGRRELMKSFEKMVKQCICCGSRLYLC